MPFSPPSVELELIIVRYTKRSRAKARDYFASTRHEPHSFGVSSASLGTSAVIAVALLLQ